jgi:hypothetical protein
MNGCTIIFLLEDTHLMRWLGAGGCSQPTRDRVPRAIPWCLTGLIKAATASSVCSCHNISAQSTRVLYVICRSSLHSGVCVCGVRVVCVKQVQILQLYHFERNQKLYFYFMKTLLMENPFRNFLLTIFLFRGIENS